MKKRADMTSSQLVKMILFFVVLLVLIVLAIKFLVFMHSSSDIEKCRTSVLSKSYTKIGGTDSPIPLMCKTRVIQIREDGVYLYEKKKRDYILNAPKFTGNLENNVKRAIAEEMAACWYQFFEGTIIPFGQSTTFGDVGYCVICSDISFNEKIKTELGKSEITNFIDWLDATKIPGNEYTYFSYLSNRRTRATHPFPFWYSKESFNTLDTLDKFYLDESYSILYYLYTPAWLETSGKRIGLSYEEQKAILFVVETENVEKLECDKLI